MKKHKARSIRSIKLEIGKEDYLLASELKKRLKARTWNEFFLKLLELSKDLPDLEDVSSMGEERIAEEADALRRDIQAYLDELMRPLERTPLEEVFDKERMAKIIHTGRMIKIVLQLMKEDAEKQKTR